MATRYQQRKNAARSRRSIDLSQSLGEQREVLYITKRQNGIEYYVSGDTGSDYLIITWTAQKHKAMQFMTEAGAYYYVWSHMNDRKDIILTSGQPK